MLAPRAGLLFVPVSNVYYITHPDVVVDPEVPVPRWPLSEIGRARMRELLEAKWVRGLGALYCSTEQKALDGAEILGEGLSLSWEALESLCENDRSATGFMAREEFEGVVERFFAEPEKSVRGWETAADAQRRIVAGVDEVVGRSPGRDLAIVAHGGVGNLLLCHVKGVPISQSQEQPLQGPEPGRVGGCWFSFEAASRKLVSDWTPIDS